MKVTNTRRTEKAIIDLYYCSMKKDDNEKSLVAKTIIETIKSYFEIISIFTNENHLNIITNLYFTSKNILEVGTRQMANKVFIQERSLLIYRQKYCAVIEKILELHDFKLF